MQVREAAAALARLVITSEVDNRSDVSAIFARLRSASPRLTVTRDGPYLFEGAAEVKDYLGVPIESRGRLLFCRCGQSASKPFCDGSHALSGFTGDKHRDESLTSETPTSGSKPRCSTTVVYARIRAFAPIV